MTFSQKKKKKKRCNKKKLKQICKILTVRPQKLLMWLAFNVMNLVSSSSLLALRSQELLFPYKHLEQIKGQDSLLVFFLIFGSCLFVLYVSLYVYT